MSTEAGWGDDGPVAAVKLNHSIHLPVYSKARYHALHPQEGPAITLISGGTAARSLAQSLARLTHNTTHVLPVFDDGGSSRELRQRLYMPPPGDLRNRLMALSDFSQRGNPEVSRLFQTRLPAAGDPAQLRDQLEAFLGDDHPQMAKIEPRYRRIIQSHLERFFARIPADFDLRGGSIGNFVIAGAYLDLRDIESVIFELSALAAVRGQVLPICCAANLHLKAELADGTSWVGQSRISHAEHAAIERLMIVEAVGESWREVRPPLNTLAEQAIRRASLVVFSMGSFYTSVLSNLLVGNIGEVIRQTRRPRIFVANLRRDRETPSMTVSDMLGELYRYLAASDPSPGDPADYINYVLVSDHGASASDDRVPVDLGAIRALGVEPIVLPLECAEQPGVHDADLVAAVLVSLC